MDGQIAIEEEPLLEQEDEIEDNGGEYILTESDDMEIDALLESAQDDDTGLQDGEYQRVEQSSKFSNPHVNASRDLFAKGKRVGCKI